MQAILMRRLKQFLIIFVIVILLFSTLSVLLFAFVFSVQRKQKNRNIGSDVTNMGSGEGFLLERERTSFQNHEYKISSDTVLSRSSLGNLWKCGGYCEEGENQRRGSVAFKLPVLTLGLIGLCAIEVYKIKMATSCENGKVVGVMCETTNKDELNDFYEKNRDRSLDEGNEENDWSNDRFMVEESKKVWHCLNKVRKHKSVPNELLDPEATFSDGYLSCYANVEDHPLKEEAKGCARIFFEWWWKEKVLSEVNDAYEKYIERMEFFCYKTEISNSIPPNMLCC